MEKKKSERNIFGFDGSFINFCDKLFDVMALGFLWILCSLPIITIGASSTALYYAMVKCIKKGDGYIAKEFFRSFRMNLIPGTILIKETDGKVGLFFICVYAITSIYILAASCYIFPALSRFDMNVRWFVKIGLYMVVRYFGTTLALLLVLVCAMGLIWKIPMLMFFLPGPVAFVMSDFLERVLKKHEPQNEEKNM